LNSESGSNIAVSDEQKWIKRFWVLLGILFFIRLFFLMFSSLDLSGDEAYYWDWSRRLDWCYFSKPPLVAWIIAFFTSLMGSTTFAVRFPAVTLSILSLAALFLLGKRMVSAKVGFWAVLVSVAAPGSCALALIMTIDAPLICCWSWALYTLWRALEEEKQNWRWWFLTAIFLGIGNLSKPTMLAFIPILLVFLWLGKDNKRYRRSLKPYLFIILSLVSLSPVIWWNWQHDWITFQHSSSHFSAEGETALITLDNFGDFIGSQLGLVSPLTWILIIGLSWICLIRFRRINRMAQCLLLFSAIPVFLMLILSLRQQVHGNWSAPFYLSAAVLLATWGIGDDGGLVNILPKWRRLFKPAIYLGMAMVVLTYGLALYVPGSSYGGSVIDPTYRIRGWKEMGQVVNEIKQRVPEPARTLVMSTNRQFTSELAFYLPEQPRVFLYPRYPYKVDNQYDIWGGPLDRLGWNALIVTDADHSLPDGIEQAFMEFKKYDEVIISLGPYRERHLIIYYGRDLRSWPKIGQG
jgi:undecaprenyl-diphosphatase